MINNNFKRVQLVSFLLIMREETFIKVRLYGVCIQHLYGDDRGW